MNKEEYVVTCSKCGSSNVKYEYDKTTYAINSKETKTPVKCNSCKYQTEEIK